MALYQIRETLTENRTYYVSTDGNNDNNGLTNDASGAFLTIQKAVDVISNELDPLGYAVTIQVADGTYNESLRLKTCQGSNITTIKGNSTTPANVRIVSSSGSAIAAYGSSSSWRIDGVSVSTTTNGYGLAATDSSKVYLKNIVFESCAYGHVSVLYASHVKFESSYSITGSASVHMYCTSSSTVEMSSISITLSGTPSFSSAFVIADYTAAIIALYTTFSGSATGARYSSRANSVIETGGSGSSYFPGSSAGGTYYGGQYI